LGTTRYAGNKLLLTITCSAYVWYLWLLKLCEVLTINMAVKQQSRYRPRVAQRDPGS